MSDTSKYPENEPKGTRLSGAVIGATILTAALIGASALVVVVTTSPLAANTAAVSSPSPQPKDTPASGISATGSLAPASTARGKSSAPAVSNVSAGQDVRPSPSSSVSPAAVSPQSALRPSSPSKTSKWVSSRSGTLMDQITDDSGLVLQDYSVRDYVSTLRECSVLAAEVKSAQAQTAIPDPAMQKRYASALTEFASGARSCSAAITQHSDGPENVTTTVNRPVMAQALSDFGTGSRDLYVATEKLRRQ